MLDYRIWSDQAEGVYAVVESGLTALSYTITGLSAGKTYSLTIQARNAYGYSLDSAVVSILAA